MAEKSEIVWWQSFWGISRDKNKPFVSVKAFKFFSLKIVETFTEAIQTVDAKQAGGKYGQLWIDFAKFYENNEQLDDARYIFDKATKATFKSVDELATLWCEWAEMELRHEWDWMNRTIFKIYNFLLIKFLA